MKLHIVFGNSEYFEAVRDSEALTYAQKKVDRIKGTDQELQVNIGNYIVMLAFRVLVLRGVISPNEIVFYVAKHPITSNVVIDKSTFDEPYTVDKNGRFDHNTPDFDKVQSNMFMEILSL